MMWKDPPQCEQHLLIAAHIKKDHGRGKITWLAFSKLGPPCHSIGLPCGGCCCSHWFQNQYSHCWIKTWDSPGTFWGQSGASEAPSLWIKPTTGLLAFSVRQPPRHQASRTKNYWVLRLRYETLIADILSWLNKVCIFSSYHFCSWREC